MRLNSQQAIHRPGKNLNRTVFPPPTKKGTDLFFLDTLAVGVMADFSEVNGDVDRYRGQID